MATIKEKLILPPFFIKIRDKTTTLKIALSNNCLKIGGNLGFAKEPYKTRNKVTNENNVLFVCNGSSMMSNSSVIESAKSNKLKVI